MEILTSLGPLREAAPISYQEKNDQRQLIASEYLLRDNFVTFSFPEGYDECSELVIDPLLIFSTYSGSTADNWGRTATPGERGILYIAGITRQADGGFFPAMVGAFQTTNQGSFDMAIIKYDSTGSNFLYATYLGGSKNDSPKRLVVDEASGDLIVLGLSSSPDFPTSETAFDATSNGGTSIFNRVLNTTDVWDIVITHLTPTGEGEEYIHQKRYRYFEFQIWEGAFGWSSGEAGCTGFMGSLTTTKACSIDSPALGEMPTGRAVRNRNLSTLRGNLQIPV